MGKSRFSWEQASLWVRIALGLVLLVGLVDKIRTGLPEHPGLSELPNALLHTLGLAFQTRLWNVAGILALFILWLFLQLLDRRLGDYRPFSDYWEHSISWIALYFFMAGWELVKLMTPSISKVSVDWLVWVYLVLSLIIDYSLWVVALGPNGLKIDRLNWDGIDFATVMLAAIVVFLFEAFQGKSSAWQWLLPSLLLLLASTAIILHRLYGGFPTPKKFRWVGWVFWGALAVVLFLAYFSQQVADGSRSFTNFVTALLIVFCAIGCFALIADSALRFKSRRRRHRLGKINDRYQRHR